MIVKSGEQMLYQWFFLREDMFMLNNFVFG